MRSANDRSDGSAHKHLMPMMGSETELGIVGGWSLKLARGIQDCLARNCPHLPAARGGIFLENGARAYVDSGKHNEICTPEVSTPWDYVRYELACRKLMQDAASAAKLQLLCSNIEPVTGRSVWGNHENVRLSTEWPPERLNRLFTHLVTRVIYTGAGGIDPDRAGLHPVFSPRVCRLHRGFCSQGTAVRSLVYEKPGMYGPGYRLHIFAGESLMCHYASLLKIGATALIVHAFDRGIDLGPGTLAEPMRVMRRVNRDICINNVYRIQESGLRMTAIDMQESFLEQLAKLDPEQLPEWAPDMMQAWQETLQHLRNGQTEKLSRRLDCHLFRQLIAELIQENGVDEKCLARLNASLFNETCTAAEAALVTRLRYQAAELYLRLHILGPDSLFHRLETMDGRLDHRVPTLTDERIETAMTQPPPGRAANRCRFIHKYRDQTDGTVYGVDWHQVHSPHFLHDVPETHDWSGDEKWRPKDWCRTPPDYRAAVLFRSGFYRDTAAALHAVDPRQVSDTGWRLFELRALSLARMGELDRCCNLLLLIPARYRNSLEATTLELHCGMEFGLVPPTEALEPVLRRAEAASDHPYAANEEYAAYLRFVIDLSRFRLAAANGSPQANILTTCRHALADPAHRRRPRMRSRTHCAIGDFWRARGNVAKAAEHLGKAIETYRSLELSGDLADHALPLLAKIGTMNHARSVLAEAEMVQRQTRNPLGLCRTLCIRARRLGSHAHAEEINHLWHRVPALRACPVIARIVSQWDEWTSPPEEIQTAGYWGL